MGTGTDFAWRLSRLRATVEPAVEAVLAPYATSYCLRPLRRRDEVGDEVATVRWSVDGDMLAELVFDGRVRLVVHDVGLLRPLRKRLRSRRIQIEHSR